jgi:hypothetical protein
VILKFVALLVIFTFVIYVFKAITRLSFNLRKTAKEINQMRDQMGGRSATINSTAMLRCLACGAFVSAKDAKQIVSAGKAQTFCSDECLQTHAKSL